MKKNCAILILSCDKYADLWNAFFDLWFRYWPDCPYHVYLGTNTKKSTVRFQDKRIKVVYSSEDKDWSSSLHIILKQIKENNILIWLDDLFLISNVDESILQESFHTLFQNTAKHIHIYQIPRYDRISTNPLFGILDKGAPYRVNVFGFWNKTYLNRLLIDGESVWQFETNGSYRTSYDDGFYVLLKYPFQYLHTIEKGKFFPGMIDIIKKYINTFAPNRQELAEQSQIKSWLKKEYFNIAIKISWRIRVRIMDILRKLFISY